MILLAHAIATLVSALIAWLFWDALKVRFEEKTFLKLIGFGFLTLVNAVRSFSFIDQLSEPQFINTPLSIWAISIAFFCIFLSFALDEHFRLQLTIIFPILALLFLRNHWQITLQALTISLAVLQLTYTTKHRDLIPFGMGFILITIAEFFLSINEAGMAQAAAFLWLFAHGAFIYWWWSYVAIRFSINSLGPRLKV